MSCLQQEITEIMPFKYPSQVPPDRYIRVPIMQISDFCPWDGVKAGRGWVELSPKRGWEGPNLIPFRVLMRASRCHTVRKSSSCELLLLRCDKIHSNTKVTIWTTFKCRSEWHTVRLQRCVTVTLSRSRHVLHPEEKPWTMKPPAPQHRSLRTQRF